ncbi:unnamed protein product [Blepharisma stoltei]|uniref:Cyclic nucleotide-binding domain-containing protein n=1 Tax=Blepharisma stoltei TaxID=1481888 RepID=A0AAU9K872_9CILI|nr:unnamed protein product [Blepharisma stoltei]
MLLNLMKINFSMSFSNRPFEIKGDLLNKRTKIFELLSVPSELRQESQTYEISEILKENPVLFRYKGTGQLEELAKHFEVEKFEPGDFIDMQRYAFFIVYTGRAALYEDQAKIKEFVQDYYFGYWDIENNAEVRSIDYSEIIVIKKSFWDEIIIVREPEYYQEKFEFIKTVELFEETPEPILSQLAQSGYLKKFLPNSIVIKQGELSKGIYIIKTGGIKLLRKTKASDESENTRIVTLDELAKGDTFSEASLFSNEPSYYTALCILPLTAYFIDKEDFKEIDKFYLYDLQKKIKNYPNDEELQRDYTEKKKWNLYQKKLIFGLKKEKLQEKGFSTNLRGNGKKKKKVKKDEINNLPPLISPRRSLQLNLQKYRHHSSFA